MIIDETDRDILEELRKNAKITTRELAKKLRLKRSTVHDRMAKLVKEGIITQFTIKAQSEAIDEGFAAFVLVSVKEWKEHLAHHPCIKEIYRISGEYEYLLKIKCKDAFAFNDFLKAFKKQPEIEKVATMVATDVLRE